MINQHNKFSFFKGADHQRKTGNIINRLVIAFISAIMIAGYVSPVPVYADQGLKRMNRAQYEMTTGESQALENDTQNDEFFQETVLLDDNPTDAPDINGTAYLLYDALSETFLMGENCDETLAPASTTKVLTIILALENLDLDDVITVTSSMYDYIPDGYVRIGLVEGEEITVRDAIYASLLISANDACSALAFAMGGSREGFAEMMNQRAKELGCNRTHFTNPFGYSDAEHLTTVHDMALIMQKALEYSFFREVSTTASYVIMPTNMFSDKRTLNNGNRFISTTTYSYDKYVAGKTGYTDLSGHTIVAAAESEGRTLIGVIFGATSSETRYENLIDLFEYGFSEYTTTNNEISEYENIIRDVTEQIDVAVIPHHLSVSDTTTDLQTYITVPAFRSSGGYSTIIDLSGAVADPELSAQTLRLPICRRYADGTTVIVGTLSVTLSKERLDVNNTDNDNDKENENEGIIWKVVTILVLVIILLVGITIFIRIHKRRKSIIDHGRTKVL
ncbi:MAG: D-alanyl-D-alanine carboxypeptidase [Clostridiales bacterium]|nr:D-alanyl-D-alanine carboxypeptidase [Clostridiales bacterium]